MIIDIYKHLNCSLDVLSKKENIYVLLLQTDTRRCTGLTLTKWSKKMNRVLLYNILTITAFVNINIALLSH